MLIKGGRVFTYSQDSFSFVRKDMRVEKTKIVKIAEELSPLEEEEIVYADGMLVLPGLTNAHYHSYTNILKGTSSGEPLELWTPGTVALGGLLDREEMTLSACMGIVEMLRNGVTSCVDHIPHLPHVDSIAQAYRDTGFRAGIAPMIHDISDHFLLTGLKEYFTDPVLKKLKEYRPLTADEYSGLYENWIEKWHRPKEGVQVILGPNAPQRASAALLERMGELNKRWGLAVHTHLLESRWQRDSSDAAGEDVVEKLDKAGLLSERTSLAHSVWLSREQTERIAKAGATIVHNPASNLFLGSGKAPVQEYKKSGIRIALGSDGSNCATNHNVLELARLAALLARLDNPYYEEWLTPTELWKMATINGSWATGWKNQAGALEEGCLADIVFEKAEDMAYYPEYDYAVQMLFNLERLNPVHVMINGKFVMRDKKILSLDEAGLREELLGRSSSLRDRLQTGLEATGELYGCYKRAYIARSAH